MGGVVVNVDYVDRNMNVNVRLL